MRVPSAPASEQVLLSGESPSTPIPYDRGGAVNRPIDGRSCGRVATRIAVHALVPWGCDLEVGGPVGRAQRLHRDEADAGRRGGALVEVARLRDVARVASVGDAAPARPRR